MRRGASEGAEEGAREGILPRSERGTRGLSQLDELDAGDVTNVEDEAPHPAGGIAFESYVDQATDHREARPLGVAGRQCNRREVSTLGIGNACASQPTPTHLAAAGHRTIGMLSRKWKTSDEFVNASVKGGVTVRGGRAGWAARAR